MSHTICLVGALDTKGEEFAFARARIEAAGCTTLVVDSGVVGAPSFPPDIPASEVARAGGTTLERLRQRADRGHAIEVMARGAAVVARGLFDEGRIQGLFSMGGSAGTAIGSSAMRALPVGVPKVMLSTIASGDVTSYVGTSDVVMVPSVVDVAGINRISARIIANAAAAVAGMVLAPPVPLTRRPLLAASMFGNTTRAVDQCRARLEAAGYEVLVFHATGTGGRTLERLVAEGHIAGVLDITTTELADELAGGVLSAGPTRLDAAAAAGVPLVIAPGCLDMVNFWAPESVPARYAGRRLYHWNPNVTLMRTTPEENRALGRTLAEKANAARGPVAIFLPAGGLSLLDRPGEPFWWPEATAALFEAVRAHIRPDIPVVEMACDINDPAFAVAVSDHLLAALAAGNGGG